MGDAVQIVDRLEAAYRASVMRLQADLAAFLDHRTLPDRDARRRGAYAYPALRLTYAAKAPAKRLPRAYARFSQAGIYSTTITRPDLFRPYLVQQLSLLLGDYPAEAEVLRSSQEIPFPYVLDGSVDLSLADATSAEIAQHFPVTDLAAIGDEVPDGLWQPPPGEARPLALFDAPRTDFSLARLAHYTGGPADHMQSYVLFTNYHRYVDEFIRWGVARLAEPDGG
jgi:AMP nucleosidase